VQQSAVQPCSSVPERASATMPGGLQQREAEGEVAGVLRDLGLPGLALLLEASSRGITTTSSCRMMLAVM
jgi:hypothetical protein